tara:strand:- start:585 stop:1085 length:501 start_codon:yes stop_codon:yes gene_type:complete
MAWTKLAEIDDSSTTDNVDSGAFSEVDWLFIQGKMNGTGAVRINFQLGDGGSIDTDTNYYQRYAVNFGGTWSTNNAINGIRGDQPSLSNSPTYFTYIISNPDGFLTSVWNQQSVLNGNDDTTAPIAVQMWATWNETNQANIINFNNRETGSFTSIKATIWGTNYNT